VRGTRQRALCRVPEIKHSAKNMALGKEPNSGSVCNKYIYDIYLYALCNYMCCSSLAHI
jgi:hypothetical protein